jgi:hypothetical protein
MSNLNKGVLILGFMYDLKFQYYLIFAMVIEQIMYKTRSSQVMICGRISVKLRDIFTEYTTLQTSHIIHYSIELRNKQ